MQRISVTKNIQNYIIRLVYDDDNLIGAIVEGGRLSRPIYIAKSERVKLSLPKPVKKFLIKNGFNIE